MKNFIAVILFACIANVAYSQINQPLLNSYHFNLNSARYNPALLGMDSKKIHINIFNVYAYGTTNFANGDVLRSALSDDGTVFNISDLDLDNLNDKNLVGVGGLVELLNLGFTFGNKKKSDLFSLKFGVASRGDFTGNFSRDLLNLAIDGNAPIRGQSVDIAPVLNGFGGLEINLGGAINLDFISSDILSLRGGVNLKYILPSAGIYTDRSSADFFTAADGSEVAIDYDLLIHTAAVDEDSDRLFVGNGFGVDIGVHAEVLDHFFGGISVLDLGTINFDDPNNTAFVSTSTVTFDGVEFDVSENEAEEIDIDSLFNLEEQRGGSFSIPLPSKIVFTAGFRTKKKTAKDKTYYPHTVKLTYVQGFDENSGSTSNPFVTASYVHAIKTVLNLGVNVGVAGLNRFQSGAFFSVKGGPFRFGLGSSNAITAIAAPDNATGLDIQSTMTFAF